MCALLLADDCYLLRVALVDQRQPHNPPANAEHREMGLCGPSRGGITSIGKSWGNPRPPVETWQQV